MIKKAKKYFIPHRENDYKPHIFREASVALLLAIIVGVFASSIIIPTLIKNSGLLASIYSSVIADSTNKDRQVAANLPSLSINPLLVAAAQAKANDMATRGYFAHNTPDGNPPWYWITKAGYNYLYAGENLAVDFTDSQDVENAWMNSPGHRANILNSHFTEVGIATAQGMLDGKSTIFVVEMFGSPRPQAASAATVAVNPAPVTPPATTPLTVTTVTRSTTTRVIATAPAPVSQDVETVASTSNFLAVRVKGEEISPSSTIAAGPIEPTHYSNWYEKIIVNPSETLQIIYWALAAFIIISLLLFVFLEHRVQHPKNIAYACMLIVIIITLLFFHQALFPSNLAVI